MPPLHRGVLNGGASEHKTKRIVKDKNQSQEQLTYLGSGFNVFCTFHFHKRDPPCKPRVMYDVALGRS